MEWLPDVEAAEAARRGPSETESSQSPHGQADAIADGLAAARGAALNEGQAARVSRIFDMHDTGGEGRLTEGQLFNVLRDMGIRPDTDEDERIATEQVTT